MLRLHHVEAALPAAPLLGQPGRVMRLVAIALCTVVSSISFTACVEEKVEAPRPAAKVEPQRPAPAPAVAPTPSRDAVRIGPGGVVVETSDPNREGSLKIDFPKR